MAAHLKSTWAYSRYREPDVSYYRRYFRSFYFRNRTLVLADRFRDLRLTSVRPQFATTVMKLDGLATGIADCAPVAVLIDVTEVEAESLR